MKNFIAACLFLPALVIVACSGLSYPSTRSGLQPTATPVLTRTFTPPVLTDTLAPTSPPRSLTETPDFASAWQGIPIMPSAIAGDGDEEGYVFTIQATPVQVQEYYRLELGRRGWWLLARGEGNALIFTNNASEMLTVNILVKEDKTLVLLVK